jgi:hypothetical protein
MLTASHIVVGTAAGVLCKRAWVAVPVAFISHFVLDQIPHSCFNMIEDQTGINGVLIYAGMVLSFAVAAWAISLAWRLPTRWVSIAAAIAAFLPDPLCYQQPINQWFAMLPGSNFVPWAHAFHCDVTKSNPTLGFITQVVVVGIGLYYLSRTLVNRRRISCEKV